MIAISQFTHCSVVRTLCSLIEVLPKVLLRVRMYVHTIVPFFSSPSTLRARGQEVESRLTSSTVYIPFYSFLSPCLPVRLTSKIKITHQRGDLTAGFSRLSPYFEHRINKLIN